MRCLKKACPTRLSSGTPPLARDHVRHGAAGAQVVEDRRAGVLEQQGLGEQRGDEVAGHELAVLVDEEAAVGVAVPGDAEIGALRHDPGPHLAAVLLEQRVGLVVGEGAVHVEVQFHALDRRALEHRRRQLAGDAVGGIHDHAVRHQRGHVHERAQMLDVGRVEVHGLVADAGHRPRHLGDRLAALLELGDALVAAERQRTLADELHAVVLRRVVRGGDHRSAAEAA